MQETEYIREQKYSTALGILDINSTSNFFPCAFPYTQMHTYKIEFILYVSITLRVASQIQNETFTERNDRFMLLRFYVFCRGAGQKKNRIK